VVHFLTARQTVQFCSAVYKHPSKMVTIEPVIDFDIDVMLDWMKNIKPLMIWLGYDSRNNNLPEPSLEKFKELFWALSKEKFIIILKNTRSLQQRIS